MVHDPTYGLNEKQAAAMREFLLIRSDAIGHYGSFEQSLAELFGSLAGMDEHQTGIIFFRINDVRAIVGMLEKLKRLAHGAEHNLFFNSCMVGVKRLADERNSIIHWVPRLNVNPAEDAPLVESSDEVFYTLAKPSFWESISGSPVITLAEIESFTLRCAFMRSALWLLSWAWREPKNVPQSSLDILSEAFPYPPPDTHPLMRTFPELENPPRS